MMLSSDLTRFCCVIYFYEYQIIAYHIIGGAHQLGCCDVLADFGSSSTECIFPLSLRVWLLPRLIAFLFSVCIYFGVLQVCGHGLSAAFGDALALQSRVAHFIWPRHGVRFSSCFALHLSLSVYCMRSAGID